MNFNFIVQDIGTELVYQVVIPVIVAVITVFFLEYYLRDYILRREGYANIETDLEITPVKKVNDLTLVLFRIMLNNIGKTKVNNRKTLCKIFR